MIRPGLSPRRMASLITRIIADLRLDLSGWSVLTEAATGAYASTPVIAAAAGATRVHAIARASRYGSAASAVGEVLELANAIGCTDGIVFHQCADSLPLAEIDLVTNSGHVRPINAALVARLPRRAVISLMYEAWELREEDVDIDACWKRGVRVVGVAERHRAIDVFSYLGPLCVHILHSAGIAVYQTRLAVVCDNAFAGYLSHTLQNLGAKLSMFSHPAEVPADDWDAVVVALTPGPVPRIGAAEAAALARATPDAIIVQFWGDIDRAALSRVGLSVWPPAPPRPGHMGALLSDIGPDGVIRLQAGGLKAAEAVLRGSLPEVEAFAQPVNPNLRSAGSRVKTQSEH